MTMIAGTADLGGHPLRGAGPVRVWLYAVAVLIVAMVLVGGATRLTDSGLSITEWRPIHGIVPPLSDAEWHEEFAKYQAIPEYQIVNRGMTLSEFKAIFWWEWAHRFLGRFIGIAFAVPLIWFWATGRIGRALLPQLLGILALGALQGAVGWWMVASGLVERTDVSQYRLAVHLTIAFAILGWVLWVARGLSPAAQRRLPSPAGEGQNGRGLAGLLLVLVFVQVFLGGLVAGLDAGLVSSTWPTMDGLLIPDGMWILDPVWRNLFENPVAVQFDHRMVAYLILILAGIHAFRMRGGATARGAFALVAALVAQAAIGIAAVIHEMPLAVALLHQFGAAVVLAAAVFHLHDLVHRPQVAIIRSPA